MWWRAGLLRQGVSCGSPSRHLENSEFVPGSEVYDLINSGEMESILKACLVQDCVIYTHPPSPIPFWYKN
jgi:hypothetical protein